jgi:hypothetical protein
VGYNDSVLMNIHEMRGMWLNMSYHYTIVVA